jgi:hypothetical protein
MKWLDNIIDSILLQESDNYENILDDNSVVSTANMINVGRNRAAIIAGSKMAQFSAILDRRTCPLCKELDGMYVEVGSADHLEYTPPIHSKCRCIWVYIGNEDRMPIVNFKKPDQELIKKHGNLIGKSGSMSKLLGDTTKVSSKDLEDMTKALFKGLTEEEKEAIVKYTYETDGALNYSLRFGRLNTSLVREKRLTWKQIREQKALLDAAFGKAPPLDRDINVYRFSTSNIFKDGIENIAGKTFKDKGYASTTINGDAPKFIRQTDVFFKIKVPKGNKVVAIDGQSNYEQEEEILLKRGTKLKITNVTYNQAPEEITLKNIRTAGKERWNMYIVECEVVK